MHFVFYCLINLFNSVPILSKQLANLVHFSNSNF